MFKEKEIPNCNLCRWMFISYKTHHTGCGAQGGVLAIEVYNTKECQRLYEIRPSTKGKK